MSFVISVNKIDGGEKFGEVYVKGNYYKHSKGILVFKGECSDYKDGEFCSRIIRGGTYIVPEVKGEFLIIYYECESRKVYFANSKLGRETLFYFYDGDSFILSDDFWEIINLIAPSASEIDAQSVKEFAVFHHALFHKTIVKNVNFLPPASIGEFSLEGHTCNLKQYWDFRYKLNEHLTISEAADRLDRLLDNGVRQIKERNGEYVVYGVGLSGGLDSRLIPHYALKHNLALRSFIIGEKRPHKFILSGDHSSARKLAKYYKVEHCEVEYDSENFGNKSFYDVRYFPMGSSQVFITVHSELPKFEILLTGMDGGELLGATLPSNIMRLNAEELLDAIIQFFSYMYVFKKKIIISKLLRYPIRLTKLMFRSNSFEGVLRSEGVVKRERIDGIIDETAFITARAKIHQFIKANSDKPNIDILQKYLFFHIAYRNKYGAFGSLHGRQKSYSVFLDPYLLEEALTWKPEFLINRRLQNYFFVKRFPELAKIKAQDAREAIYYRNRSNSLRRVVAFVMYFIRGVGVMRYVDWAWSKRYKDYSSRIILREGKIFNSIFDTEKVMKLAKEDMRIYENLVKLKQILDLIETKGYKNFFEYSEGEKSSKPRLPESSS